MNFKKKGRTNERISWGSEKSVNVWRENKLGFDKNPGVFSKMSKMQVGISFRPCGCSEKR
jgi:uncharacterized membrane protein